MPPLTLETELALTKFAQLVRDSESIRRIWNALVDRAALASPRRHVPPVPRGITPGFGWLHTGLL